jgi:hypothetical protein
MGTERKANSLAENRRISQPAAVQEQAAHHRLEKGGGTDEAVSQEIEAPNDRLRPQRSGMPARAPTSATLLLAKGW